MRRRVTDIVSQGDEPRGQRVGAAGTGAGILAERVPVVLNQALWTGEMGFKRQTPEFMRNPILVVTGIVHWRSAGSG